MCRQIEIKTCKSTLLADVLPEDVNMHHVLKGENKISIPSAHVKKPFTYIEGNWQHIGTLDQMTEEVWKGIVNDPHTAIDWFYDYQKQEYRVYTATESGISLLKANGVLLDNPHGNMPVENNYEYVTSHTGIEDYNRDIERWQEAQSKLFDRNRTRFFIKQD